MTVSGRLFDGKSAKAQAVLLELAGDRLILKNEAGVRLGDWPLDELRDENVVAVKSALRVSVAGGDEARLIIEEPEFVAELRRLCPRLRKKRAAPPGWWKPYLYWGGGAALSVVIIFTVVLPLLASQIAYLIPDSTRDEIGRGARDYFINAIASRQKTTPEAVTCKSVAANRVLQRLVSDLGAAGDGDLPVTKVTVIRTKAANAFALPGGQLLVFSGLIDMADSPNGLAGVLAHEIGHAKYRHPTRLFVANTGVATVFSLLLGDVTGGTFLAAMGQLTVGSAYSRDFEREADRTAVELMQAAGYDISPMILLMKKISTQGGADKFSFSFLNSHPGVDERISLLAAAGNAGGPALTAEDWALVKNMCK
ncbi:MAG: M48 family metallopeptidase [Sneathiella sp.]|nr:M48 family metallopeptidase [Sneathiella sp.]